MVHSVNIKQDTGYGADSGHGLRITIEGKMYAEQRHGKAPSPKEFTFPIHLQYCHLNGAVHWLSQWT